MHGMNMAGKVSILEDMKINLKNNDVMKKELDFSDCNVSWAHDDDKSTILTDFYRDNTEFKKDRGSMSNEWYVACTSKRKTR